MALKDSNGNEPDVGKSLQGILYLKAKTLPQTFVIWQWTLSKSLRDLPEMVESTR